MPQQKYGRQHEQQQHPRRRQQQLLRQLQTTSISGEMDIPLPDEQLLPVQDDAAAANPIMTEKLRQDLLENYDRGSFPWEHVWNESKSSPDYVNKGVVKGLDVQMNLNFHKIFEVDSTRSVIDIVAWVRLQWKDPRLAWNPSDYDNTTETFFWIGDGSGSGGETSEIWTPDIQVSFI